RSRRLAAGFHRKALRSCVVGYVVPANVVAAVAPQARVVEEFDAVRLAVVFDPDGLPVDVAGGAFLLVTESRRIPGRDAGLEALLVLANHDALGADDQRTLRQHHLSFERGGLLAFVGGHAVRLDVHRLVAIGPLGACRRSSERPRRREREGAQPTFSRAAHRTCPGPWTAG